MPKVPKKVPTCLAVFGEYVKKHEQDQSTHNTVDAYSKLSGDKWEQFYAEYSKTHEEKPKKKRATADPFKSLGKVLAQVAERVDAVNGDDAAMTQYKDQIQQSVPPRIKPMFSSEGKGKTKNLSKLIEKTNKNLTTLIDVTKKVHSQVDDTLKVHTQSAVDTLGKMSENMQQLEDTIAN